MADAPPPKPPKPGGATTATVFLKSVKKDAAGLKCVTPVGPSPANAGWHCIAVRCAKEQMGGPQGEEKFFVYMVEVKLSSARTVEIPRRFNDFMTFHNEWKHEYPSVAIACPPKLLKTSDEDVARRCVELQEYLHDLVAVSALIYWVAKFLKVDEADLKTAVKGKSDNALGTSTPLTPGHARAHLPKVHGDAFAREQSFATQSAEPDPDAPPPPPKPKQFAFTRITPAPYLAPWLSAAIFFVPGLVFAYLFRDPAASSSSSTDLGSLAYVLFASSMGFMCFLVGL